MMFGGCRVNEFALTFRTIISYHKKTDNVLDYVLFCYSDFIPGMEPLTR